MGKPKKAPGTWLEREMFQSPAYFALGGCAPQLLTIFMGKRHFERYPAKKGRDNMVCANCNSLTFTYIEAEQSYGITKSRFSRGIDELLAKGFISIVSHGGAYQQDKTVYALSDRWKRWTPEYVFEERPKVKVERGFCRPKKFSHS
jgi:hypothetical protein